jgi:catechol 2,3-dioxygenase-like lactoylglutathione lyase family enzyme
VEVKELGHVVLYVRDVDVSRGFYGGVLGWKEVTAVPGQMALFSSGRTHHELLLIQVGQDAAPIPQGRRVGLYHWPGDDRRRAQGRDARASGRRREHRRLGDHGVTHSLYITIRMGTIELYIDVQPEVWRKDPPAVMAPVRPPQFPGPASDDRHLRLRPSCRAVRRRRACADVCATPWHGGAGLDQWVPRRGPPQRHSRQVSISPVESQPGATAHRRRALDLRDPDVPAQAILATTTTPPS